MKRNLKLDCGEDVLEADDMVKWDGVEGRRRQSGYPVGALWPGSEASEVVVASVRCSEPVFVFGDLERRSELKYVGV